MRLSLPIWWLRGFNANLWPFRWQQDDGKFEERFGQLIHYLDSLPQGEQICMLGTSAGGVVATLMLLARPEKISHIVTVSSPLIYPEPYKNGLLNTALAKLQSQLPNTQPNIVRRITSFRGRADDVVDPKQSILPEAVNIELPTSGHILSIALAVTIFSDRLAKWYRSQ
jgi:pimeloyl-ACP methyl ester carboxylesterase